MHLAELIINGKIIHIGSKHINDKAYLGQYVMGLASINVRIFPIQGINKIRYLVLFLRYPITIIHNASHKQRAIAGIGVLKEKYGCKIPFSSVQLLGSFSFVVS